ncbi:MAG TPA: restriction endonuclease subunit M [Candidatus Accumulibacter sp.]|nr:restriction endonuclease subunit M [Accumulibacter sp.]
MDNRSQPGDLGRSAGLHSLSAEQRSQLESALRSAREIAESGSSAALAHIGVGDAQPPAHLTEEQRTFRRGLRAHGRSIGDRRQHNGAQEITRLVREVAYEHWHRMLFARYLAERGLLMWDASAAVTLAECHEMASDKTLQLGFNSGWALAGRLASRMLPQLFPSDSSVLALALAPEHQVGLERILASLPPQIFRAQDSLGWAYQYWQAKRKEEVNALQAKVGADELPAVTQLFTEDYMVEFLLRNTVGRHEKPPAELRLLDPCCGSGHFLVASFYFLVPLRQELEGLTSRDAVDAVLRDNLFGLEVDPRCVEIAAFALALAAWTYPDEGEHPLGYRPLPSLNLACCGRAPVEAEIPGVGAELTARFQQAALLGSLILSGVAEGVLQPGFAQPGAYRAVNEETVNEPDEDDAERLVAAKGFADALRLLSQRYDFVLTNPPFLGRGRMCDELRAFVESHYYEARHDLGAAFLEQCLRLTKPDGMVGSVIQQSWLFAASYGAYRTKLLEEGRLHLVANLGEGAFRSTDAAGAFPSLVILSNAKAPDDAAVRLLDVASHRTADEKMAALAAATATLLPYAEVRATGDYLIARTSLGNLPRLSQFASPYVGLQTSDYPRYCRFFWELPAIGGDWELMQEAPEDSERLTGFSSIFYWQGGTGDLMNSGLAYIRGQAAWGKAGVMVSRMRQLKTSRYVGNFFNQTCAAIIPNDQALLPALMAYCASDEYNTAVREVDRRICVANTALTRVPFDLERWSAEAAEKFPDGLPALYSDEPTQWVFHGHPRASANPLQVAVMRLLGYRWPAETNHGIEVSDTARAWIGRCEALDPHGDEDGIVCLPPIRGERAGHERLLGLLIDAWETVESGSWKTSVLDSLLTAADCQGKGIEVWLRDKFFEQHARLFQYRPPIWHVWDGLKDGFSALVNCHQLDNKNLERLIHTYLGDWIRTKEQGVQDRIDGAQLRLSAARNLKVRLEWVLNGETPYDIFVRWKPLARQPIGWSPDLNDGVRVNIRPFMQAEVLRHNKRPKLNISWDRDRGNDPENTPWYPVFGGERVNDHHLTRAEKTAAKEVGA